MAVGRLYKSLAWCYEFITTGEGHKKEAVFVRRIVKKYKKSGGNTLLDVGCGHGWHDRFLRKYFKIVGVDFSRTILKSARKRNPGVVYKYGDMKHFNLDMKFDVVMSFDAMMYNLNYADLKNTIKCLSEHLADGGVLIFHLDKLKENFREGEVMHPEQHSRGNVKMTFFQIEHDRNPEDTLFESCLVFLIAVGGRDLKVKVDKEVLGLFGLSEVRMVLQELGFKVHVYSGDFSGRMYSKDSPLPVFVCVR